VLRLGFVRLIAVVAFGIVIPYASYRLSCSVGFPIMIALAVAVGLAYGAIKADYSWSGDGLACNLRLMAASACVLAAYVGVSITVARRAAKSLKPRSE
jgi:hypothetical protein